MLLCPGPLLRLLARCEGVDLAFDATSYVPDCHIHVPMLSLPAIFGTTLETVPARVPYLTTDPVLVEHWRAELARALRPTARSPRQMNPRRLRPQTVPDRNRLARKPVAAHGQLAIVPAAAARPAGSVAGRPAGQSASRTRPGSARECAGEFPVLDLLGPRKRDFVETAALDHPARPGDHTRFGRRPSWPAASA